MPSLSTLAALMLATAVVLAVGCVGPGSGFFGEQKNHPLVTASLNQFPPENTPVHNQTSLHWISIGQTGDMHAGDVFQINATTNLSPGDEILVQVKPSAMFPGGFKVDGMQQTVRVQGRINTTNTILSDLNPTGNRPAEYLVT